MISRQDLARLSALKSEEGILTAYIRIDPRLMYDRAHPVQEFKGAAKRFLQRTKGPRWRSVLEREKERIIHHLENWHPNGRGLAIFSSRPAGIWEVIPLAVSIPSLIHADKVAYTAVLAQVLDEYPRFAVALVEADKARIYVAEQGVHSRQAEISSDVPGWHDQGGWAQARFQRHIEFHTAGHLKKVAEELERLYHRRPYSRLALGGTETTVHELQRMLPESVARRLIGTFPVNFKHHSDDQALERAHQLLVDDERRSERELVQHLLEAADSGGRGTLGIDDTLRALEEDRVHTLVIAHGVTKEGFVCEGCGHLATRGFQRCPLCGGPAEAGADIVEQVVERAYLAGVSVKTVSGEARERLLGRGGVGAVLRY